MTTARSSRREEQALAEVGHTAVARPVAVALTLVFALSLVMVTGWDALGPAGGGGGEAEPSPAVFTRYARSLGGVVPAWVEAGPVAADRELLRRMAAFEEELERGSTFAAAVGPPLRWLETAVLGAPGEQVAVGRGSWLFFRPGLELAAGPPFLDPDRLERRRLAGESWERPPQPDPLRALLPFAAELKRRGIRLVVVPAPTKAAIHPDRLTGAVPAAAAPLENPSFDRLVERLEAAGVEVFDPAPLLAAAAGAGEPQYLRGDSHWRPEAVERVAAALARRIGPWLEVARPETAEGRVGRGPGPEGDDPAAEGPTEPSARYRHRPGSAEDVGDLVRLLRLPGWQRRFRPERVPLRQVVEGGGRLWQPEEGAEVLVLGDSFTNVYSQPGLGWGTGAGLAEQLAFHLGRPVDRIAVNAGGAHASRERLAQALAYRPERLDETRVVVYEFAARELAVGDWRLVELPP